MSKKSFVGSVIKRIHARLGRFEHEPAHKFSRIILIINPQGSNIQRIEVRARELARVFPDTQIETIETTANPIRFRRKLQKSLASGADRVLLGVGGGDGTINLVANALLLAEPKINLEKIVLLPLWGGNANDFAYMLNGLSSRVTLKSLFEQGRVVAIPPLEIRTINPSGKRTTRYGVCYASFGASAYAAQQLTKPAEGKGIFGKSAVKGMLDELKRVVHAVLDAPGFDAEQDGRKVKIFEQIFSNGSRMAKIDRLPVKLTQRQFYYAVRSDKPPTFSFYIMRLLRGRKLGEIKRESVQFTLRERAWSQVDGEASVVPENTKITVGHGRRLLYALSTKLS